MSVRVQRQQESQETKAGSEWMEGGTQGVDPAPAQRQGHRGTRPAPGWLLGGDGEDAAERGQAAPFPVPSTEELLASRS